MRAVRVAPASTARYRSVPGSRMTGFTLIEFTMVMAISGILVIGLGTVIEIPRIMLEERDSNVRVSGVDRFMSIMDKDVRYCTDVRLIDGHHLEVDTADGAIVTYSFSGIAGDPLVRSSDAEVVDTNVVAEVRRAVLRVDTYSKTIITPVAAPTADTPVETASFSSFNLKSGYVITDLVGRLGGLTAVTQQTRTMGISSLRRPAFSFNARGLGADSSSAASFRAVVRRFGTGDLVVRVFQGTSGGAVDQPVRTKEIAVGRVANAALPASFQNVVIPLTSRRKITNDNSCFVEFSSSTSDFAAEIQILTIDLLDALASSNGGFARSADNGASFTPYASALPLAQSQFSFQTIQTEPVTDSLGSALQTVEIPVSVNVRVTLDTSEGERLIEFSIPLQNKLLEL